MAKIQINEDLNPFDPGSVPEFRSFHPTADGGFVALYAFEGIQFASGSNPAVGRQQVYAATFAPDPSTARLERIGSDVLVADVTHDVALDAPPPPVLLALPKGGFAVLNSDFKSTSTAVDFYDGAGSKQRSETFKGVFISSFRGGEIDLGFGDAQRFFGFYNPSSGDIHAFDTKNENFRPVPNTFINPTAFDAGHIIDARFDSTSDRVDIAGTRATRSGAKPSYDVDALGVFDGGNVANPRFFNGLASVGNLLAVKSLEGAGDKLFLLRPDEKGIGRTVEFPSDRVVSRVFEITGVGFAVVVQRLVGDELVQRIKIYDMQGDVIASPKITVFGDLDGQSPQLIKLGNPGAAPHMKLALASVTDNGPPFNPEFPDDFARLVGGETFSLSVRLDNSGTKLDDALHGFGRNDKLRGLAGDDKLEGHGGDDLLRGDSGKDLLLGGSGNDKLDGGGGADDLRGDRGNDTLKGGPGNDVLDGGEGNDRLLGGAGNDKLEGEAGDDVLVGGGGSDRINGRGDDDRLEGGANADVLIGGAGQDRLEGDAGPDLLIGSEGNDVLVGGEGADELIGDKGADRFLFVSVKHSKFRAGVDAIGDFNRRQGDKIDLRPIDANSNKRGNQDFKFIGDSEFSKVRGELRVEKSGRDVVIEGDVNGDGKADLVIMAEGIDGVNAGDFLL